MDPLFCPYCGEKEIEELDPTEMMVDDDFWIIYHYECQECSEIFDKILLKDEAVLDDMLGEEDNEEGYWS